MMTEEAKPKRKYVRKESAVKILESGWEAVSALVETCDNTVRSDTRIKPTMYLVIFPVNKISYEDMKLAIDAQDFFSSDEKVFYIPTVNEESYVLEYWNSIENTRHVIRYNPTRYNELAARKFVEYQNVFGSEAKVLYIPNSTDAMIYETIV